MPKTSLTGKVALVTGGARRVGAAIVRQLHHAGMNIALHYNASLDDALSLCEELNQKRESSVIAIRADLSAPESEKMLVLEAVKPWKRLDVLVNNASRFYRTNMGKVTEFAWDDLMTSNLKAPFFISQACAPYLKETEGCIINITDINAQKPLRNYSAYCISKGGLMIATKVLAKELGPSIRVNAISPGSVIWPEGENVLTDTEKQKIIDKTILQREGSKEDVAKAVLFFVQDGQYITGQVLSVDGGHLLFE